ncbi:MAG TPA: PA0069 family radical SAM protein [Tepidisphaeraceae bacterium]|nr:PA0069 family radical SAM protein [Tepidisphaeraceae bacterium]
MSLSLPIRGRGAAHNPPNRFEPIDVVPDPDCDLDPSEQPAPTTVYLRDASRSIIASNDSPDVMIEASINPYRGCEHGCIYCFARPTHEYFGLSAGLDFETRIFVKERAPELLRAELMSRRWDVRAISISGVTDCYQPVERKLQITRRCLQVLAEFGNPCGIITKNHLITRDVDVLRELAGRDLVGTILSVTTLDADLHRVLEPRASTPARRLAAIEALANAGVPVGVMVAPVIPGLTDVEMPAILRAAADAGASFAGYVPLRLPFALSAMFEDWLEKHFPQRKQKVLNQIRQIRGGKLNDGNFGSRMRGEGPLAEQLGTMFEMAKKRAGITGAFPELSKSHFRRPPRENEQMGLFG